MSGESKTLTIRLIGNAKSGVKAFTDTGKASDSLGAKLSRISDRYKNVGRSLTHVGTRMTAVSVAALYFVARAGADYVGSLNKIQVLSDSNDATMKRVAGTLEKNSGLYAKMGQTSGDAAGGVVELVKAGLTLDKAMKAVNATMILAKAGEMDVATASTLVSQTLNTFHMKAKDAGDIANYLANAANISSADVSDLAESLKYVAPIAAASRVSLSTVNAALAELSNNGVQASLAGTGFRNFLVSLQSPTARASKALDALGVRIFDNAGKARPFKTVVDDLSKALGGLSSEETRKGYLKDIFGKTGLNAAQILLEGGVKTLNKYEKGVVKAGAAQKLANSQSKGLAGTFAALKATLTSLAQSVYRQFSPALDKMLKPVVKLAAHFSDLSPKTKKLILIIAGIAAAAGPVILVLGMLAGAIGALLTPVGLVMGIIAALAIGFGVAYAKSEGFRNAVNGLVEAFVPFVGKVLGFLKSFIPTLKALGKELISRVGPPLKEVGELIKSELIPAFEKILPIIKPILGFLLKLFGGAVIGAILGVVQVIKGLIQVISGVFNLVSDLIHGRWSAVWHDLITIVKGVLNILVGAFKVWWNVGILSVFRRGFGMVIGLFKNGWKSILGAAKGGMKLLQGGMNKVISVLTWPFRAGFKAVMSFVRTGWKYVKGDFGKGISGIRGILKRLFEVMTYPYRVAWSATKALVSRGVSAVKSIFTTLPGKIRGALSKVKGAVTGVFKGAVGWLKDAGKNIIEGLIRGIGDAFDKVKRKLGELTDKLPDWKGPASKDKKILKPAGQMVMGGFAEGLASRFRAVRQKLGGFTSSLSGTGSSPALAGAGASVGSVYRGGYLNASGGGNVYVTVQVEGNVIGEKDFAKRVTPTVREELKKIGGRNSGNIFGRS